MPPKVSRSSESAAHAIVRYELTFGGLSIGPRAQLDWIYWDLDSFNEFNADSLNILVIYWFHPPLYWDYLEHAHGVNLQIMEQFHAEGIDFAFPTQTLHLAGDDKRPLTVGQRWMPNAEGHGETNP